MKRLLVCVACLAVLGAAVLPTVGEAAPPGKKKKKQSSAEANNPLYSLTLMREGSVLMQQGRYDSALERFQQAERVAPGNVTVYNMEGLCYMRLEQYDQALLAFDKALKEMPGYTDARNNRGATYLAMGQYHLAEVDFIAVLGDSTYPYRKQVQYNLGMTYLKRRQYGAAAENFRRAIVQPNPVFDAYLRLSELAQHNGELESSLELLEEAKLNFPERTEVSLEMGRLLVLMDRSDEAREHLERVIEAAPGSDSAAMAQTLLDTI
jgi:tetratricopeptide (TPR) repeat protein